MPGDRGCGGGRARHDALLRRDRAVFFNQASTSPSVLALRRGAGTWVEDEAGRRYLDWYGNNCHNVGYCHPRVVAALKSQVDELAFTPRGYTAEPAVRLAESLAALWPGERARVSLVPGGSAAVEAALAIARVHTGRWRTLSFHTAYHGRSAGALSVSSPAKGRSARLGPLVPGAAFVPPFYDYFRPDARDEMAARSLDAIADALVHEGDVAALIAEPIRNGPFAPPPGYWRDVRSLCLAHDTLLVFDEVPVGLGRTGAMFASEHCGVVPDITVIGKSLGGAAVPLAAVIAHERLNDAPELDLHYYTHEKNPLTAAAGLATLAVLVEEDLCARAARLGARYLALLERACRPHSVVRDVRGIGLMFGIGFAGGRNDGQRAASRFVEVAREEGVIVNARGANQVTLAPPLTIDEHDLDAGFERLERTLARVG